MQKGSGTDAINRQYGVARAASVSVSAPWRPRGSCLQFVLGPVSGRGKPREPFEHEKPFLKPFLYRYERASLWQNFMPENVFVFKIGELAVS